MLQLPYKKTIRSESETSSIAKEFVKLIQPGDKIVLNGQLGAGKTYFIKEALSEFGINNVTSPTFAIVNEYDGDFKIYHSDFFRLKNFRELIDIGWQDYMNDETAIIFIEWGNLLPEALPEVRFEIRITLNDDLTREISIQKYN
ncbi:MAG TPA: tRNA (adenosine(37)-N6)-threonylcarbamoyltransferase complex ATPase subunit type 1 TsaE [Ignavibacteriaceae bacterium]